MTLFSNPLTLAHSEKNAFLLVQPDSAISRFQYRLVESGESLANTVIVT